MTRFREMIIWVMTSLLVWLVLVFVTRPDTADAYKQLFTWSLSGTGIVLGSFWLLTTTRK